MSSFIVVNDTSNTATTNGKIKRAANFTKEETNLIVDIAMKYTEILENKQTDSVSALRKTKAWEKITAEFNNQKGLPTRGRDAKNLRSKYDSIKKELRKKCAKIRLEKNKRIEDCDFEPFEKKMLSMTKYGACFKSRSNKNTELTFVPNLNMLRNDYDSKMNHTTDNENMDLEITEIKLETNVASPEIGIESVTTFDEHAQENEQNFEDDITWSGQDNKSLDQEERDSITPVSLMGTENHNQFPYRNRNIRNRNHSSTNGSLNVQLKSEVLELEKQYWSNEIISKSKIYELTIKNLELDLELKKQQLINMTKV